MFRVCSSLNFFVLILKLIVGEKLLAVITEPSNHHQLIFQPIWRKLIDEHQLTLITTDPPNFTHPNLTLIDLSYIHAVHYKNELKINFIPRFVSEFILNYLSPFYLNQNLLMDQLTREEIKIILSNETEYFDLIFVEYKNLVNYAFGLRFNTPLIAISSNDFFNLNHPNQLTFMTPNQRDNQLTFLEKLENFASFSISFIHEYFYTENEIGSLTEKIFGESYTVARLNERLDLILLNRNEHFHASFERNFPENVLEFGFNLDLFEDDSNFTQFSNLNKSQENIYFAIEDSSRHLINLEEINLILDELPFNVINGNRNKNKFNILRHKNTKLFISECSTYSIQVSLSSGVPLICIPLTKEQRYNGDRVVLKSIGKLIDLNLNQSLNNFRDLVFEVINDDKYQGNLKILSNLIKDTPVKSTEKVIWWTNYLLRHQSMRHVKRTRMNQWNYYIIDVLLVYAGLIFLILYLLDTLVDMIWAQVQTFIRKTSLKIRKKIKRKKI